MIDPGTAAIVGPSIASAVALVVGVCGALLNRRTALEAQRTTDRAKALVRVLHIAELTGQAEQDQVFNLTKARKENESGRDPVTDEVDDPYAPRPREVGKRSRTELAEASALVAAYGTPDIDRAWMAWRRSLDGIVEAYIDGEAKYWEDGQPLTPADFAEVAGDEERIRGELASRIRQVLANGRVRRFYQPR
jgi:hypothetical protein